MWHFVKCVVLALALSSTAATAQQLPVLRQPAPPGGSCPVGYAWSGTFCLSLDGKRPPAMPKPTGSACPSGWRVSAEGSYCVTR
jgi:hypothetical protein